jgi:energy-coupling factor transporter ATP-binding protein EcfA2
MASGWMNSFMASERADFEKLRLNIMLAESKGMLIERIKTASLEGNIAKESVKASKEKGDSTLYFYTKDNVPDKLSGNIVKHFSIGTVFFILHHLFYHSVYLFPTERSIFSPPFNPINLKEKIEKSDSEIPKIEIILPGAIQHFLQMIMLCSNSVKKDMKNQPYIKLAKMLETEILQGKVGFNTSKLKKELLFHVSKNLKLEMTVASSMIKELAPLALYLKNLAEPDDLLIIDEPEMNLHPAAQVQLIEFFAMLVNAGLNILITTHSPYIVDHLANLMQAAKHKNKKKIKKLFYLEKTEAFISQDKVSVYLFEDGTAKNIVDENGVIDWGTFGNVSSDLSRIYSEILKD